MESAGPFSIRGYRQGSLCRHGLIIGKPHHGDSRKSMVGNEMKEWITEIDHPEDIQNNPVEVLDWLSFQEPKASASI